MNFEASFQRLEQILEKLSEDTLPLDAALKLYEEADGLVVQCHKTLKGAEERVEKLVKDREGQLVMKDDGTPEMEDFTS